MPRKAKKEPEPAVTRRVTRRSLQQADTCKPEASSSKVSPADKSPSKIAASPVASPSRRGGRRGREKKEEKAQDEPQAAGDQLVRSEEVATAIAKSPEVNAGGRRGRRSRGSTGAVASSPAPTRTTSRSRKRTADVAVESEEKRAKIEETEETEETPETKNGEPMDFDNEEDKTTSNEDEPPKEPAAVKTKEEEEEMQLDSIPETSATTESVPTEEVPASEINSATTELSDLTAIKPGLEQSDSIMAEPSESVNVKSAESSSVEAAVPTDTEVAHPTDQIELNESGAARSDSVVAEPSESATEKPDDSIATEPSDTSVLAESISTEATDSVNCIEAESVDTSVGLGSGGAMPTGSAATSVLPCVQPLSEEPLAVPVSSTVNDASQSTELNDYVMVDKADLPAADSAAVTAALPVVKEPVADSAAVTAALPVVKEPVADSAAVTAALPVVKEPVADSAAVTAALPVVKEPVADSAAVTAALPVVKEPVADSGVTTEAPTANPPPPLGEFVFGTMCPRSHPTMNTKTSSAPPPVRASNEKPAPTCNLSNKNGTADDPLFSRCFVVNGQSQTEAGLMPTRQFTVASYNILAECHALRDARAGNAYRWISADQLLTEARHNRLLMELQYLDADIICLQEVGPEYFSTTLQTAMSKLGYQGVMMKRAGANYDEGEATFVRQSRFHVLENRSISLGEVALKDLEESGLSESTKQCLRPVIRTSAVALLTKLQCLQTETVLSVANTHISFERFQRPDLQCVEVGCAIRELVKFAGDQRVAHIICGDFNSVCTSPIYQLIADGYINALSKAKLLALPTVHCNDKVEPLSNLWGDAFLHTSNKLKSAYETTLGSNPITSTFPHDSVMRGVDYLWYTSEALDVVGVLATASSDLIKDGIPNSVFPSDHLSVKAQFLFK